VSATDASNHRSSCRGAVPLIRLPGAAPTGRERRGENARASPRRGGSAPPRTGRTGSRSRPSRPRDGRNERVSLKERPSIPPSSNGGACSRSERTKRNRAPSSRAGSTWWPAKSRIRRTVGEGRCRNSFLRPSTEPRPRLRTVGSSDPVEKGARDHRIREGNARRVPALRQGRWRAADSTAFRSLSRRFSRSRTNRSIPSRM